MKHYPLYLANQARATASEDTAHTLTVCDKYHAIPFATVETADKELLEKAIIAGKSAESAMRALTPFQKQQILKQCVEKIKQQYDTFVEVLIKEGGKPRTFAIGEVNRLISTFELAADTVTTLASESEPPIAISANARGYRSMTQPVAVGLCAFITPFNFPLNLVAHKIAPAIAAGCPFIVKPASSTPISAVLLGTILEEVFVANNMPQGAFSILPMSAQVADALVTDERIKLLSFTGSDMVGWDMKARAGKKKVVLELGGNASVIIEPDTDLDTALPRVVTGAFAHAGQVCISVQKALIHESIYDEVTQRLIELSQQVKRGDPSDDDTVIGAMISEKEYVRTVSWLQEAIDKGARVLCGGAVLNNNDDTQAEQNARSLPATLLENVAHDAHYYHDEAFAPVLVLEKYSTFSEAIDIVNTSRFGLQVGVYTQNINKTMQAWDSIEVGAVIINDIPTFRVDNMPYGGVKDSGFGREGIRYAIEDMSEKRLLVIKC